MEVIKNLKLGTRGVIKVGDDSCSLLSFAPAVLSQILKPNYAWHEGQVYFRDVLFKERYLFNGHDDEFALVPWFTVIKINDNTLVKSQ